MPAIIDKAFFDELASIARYETLSFFRHQLVVDNKNEHGFDPVTQADVRTEQALRKYIAEKFPDHGIYGEEGGTEGIEQDFIWVIDPIDGTRNFISGIPLWGTLVGLLHKGRAVAGMMAQPFTRELFFATPEGSFFQHADDVPQKLKVRKTLSLAEATLFSTAPSLFDEKTGRGFSRLEQTVRFTRFGTDCYAFAMLAAGLIDLVIETRLKPYDVVALVPVIEKAGGVITQWNGGPAEQGGDIIAAATRQLYENAVQKLHRGQINQF
ncbi:MAG: Inositol-1-monophosphatase [Candidatus Tokpelaia sp. JSC189]|nr:MAG: Inositol-1-monophosphatase [Candidatus Tokpelaia sp. JSC189]